MAEIGFASLKFWFYQRNNVSLKKPYKYAHFSWYFGRARSLSIFYSLKIIPAPQCGYFGSAEIALFEWMIYKLHRTSLQFLICFGKNLGVIVKEKLLCNFPASVHVVFPLLLKLNSIYR